ncbi:PEPxxWA-CTERM sorting domain-containing protein [Sandarakinorhabdus sp.]|uniref:PEPxxWA-CTERM sorting domain-containing protein n=1 Tax=Sandarakinorhabdus sp. TaxID=1916663 RepID=UPI003342DD22
MFAKLVTALTLATVAITPASAAVTIAGSVTSGAMPDPASWAILLAGFGMVGFASRHKRTTAA